MKTNPLRYKESSRLLDLVLSDMFESLIYIAIGFIATLLALEIGWHITAFSVGDKTMKPTLLLQWRRKQ